MDKHFDVIGPHTARFYAQDLASQLGPVPTCPVVEFRQDPNGRGWKLYRFGTRQDNVTVKQFLAAYARAYEWYSSLPKRQLTPAEQACLGFYQEWTVERPSDGAGYLQGVYDVGKKLNDEL